MSFDIKKIINGMIAGFCGTVAMSIIMVIKKTAGVVPELDPIAMNANMIAEKMGSEPVMAIGWVMHFVIGTVVFGGAFGVVNKLLPGKSQIIKGIVLGICAWLLLMLGPMPMSGAGLFGLKIAKVVPVMTLVLHIVFGVVLGAVFSKLNGPSSDKSSS